MPATSEHRRWPIWYVPADAAADGFGGIARFVVPRLLERDHANVFTPGVRGRIEASTREGIRLPRIEADKSIMQLLWWTLKSQRIAYARPPWNPGEGQEIRSPAMLLCRNGRGTCVDLAVLLAGVCLNEGLDVLLVMLCTEDEGHVGLAIRLGRSPGGTVQQLYGTAPTGATGVSRVKSVERLMPIHEAQHITNLRLIGARVGLLLNFNSDVLRHGIRRLVHPQGPAASA